MNRVSNIFASGCTCMVSKWQITSLSSVGLSRRLFSALKQSGTRTGSGHREMEIDSPESTSESGNQTPSAPSTSHVEGSGALCPRDFRLPGCPASNKLFRFVFPDFLPEKQFDRRNHKREILERNDMLQRRLHLDIPEFYVGSLVAVTVSDPHSAGRKTRFLGICIQRAGAGLKHHFTLRNCFDGMGVEVRYDLYNPLILKIEVLRLEKRLDDELYYLRDCLPEYSTFPADMEAVPHTPGAPVPLNHTKAKLKPTSHWTLRWELYDIKGVEPFWEDVTRHRKRRFSKVVSKPWEKYDFMAEYRSGSTLEDEERIFNEMMEFQDKHSVVHRGKRKNIFHHHKAKQRHSDD